MLRSRPNATETDSADALWIRDLSQIATSYGRLVYLAGLRNPDTGRYEHYGSTSGSPSNLVASRTLKRIHESIFKEWVSYSLERKKADVELYTASIDQVDRAELIDAWLRLTPYKNLVPAAIRGHFGLRSDSGATQERIWRRFA
jgi:hypothetical protein